MEGMDDYYYEEEVLEEEDVDFEEAASGAGVETEYLYQNLEFSVFIREFKGQTSGPGIGTWFFHCSSLTEFSAIIWEKARHHVKREVLFDDTNTPHFHQDVQPIEEAGKFLLFTDKVSKLTRSLNQIREETLALWSSAESKREIAIYIHQYSVSVANKKLWEIVKSVLIMPSESDRCGKMFFLSFFLFFIFLYRLGAPAQDALNDIAKELKAKHSYRYKAADFHWIAWAHEIAKADAHLGNQLMDGTSPEKIRWYFRTPDDTILSETRRDIDVNTQYQYTLYIVPCTNA